MIRYFSVSVLLLSVSMLTCADHAKGYLHAEQAGCFNKSFHYLDCLKKELMPAMATDITSIKMALKYTCDGWFLSGLSVLGPVVNREQIELKSIYRFKNIKEVEDDSFSRWVSQQTDDSIKKIIDPVKQHTSKHSLITWQNKNYPEYLTLEQIFERLMQTQYFDQKVTKKI